MTRALVVKVTNSADQWLWGCIDCERVGFAYSASVANDNARRHIRQQHCRITDPDSIETGRG